jgi:hypothetical protein
MEEALHPLLFQRRVREDFLNNFKIPLHPPFVKGDGKMKHMVMV